MACTIMACIVAVDSFRYGRPEIYSYGLYSYGLHVDGLYRRHEQLQVRPPDPYSYGLYGYGLYSYGLYCYGAVCLVRPSQVP